MESQIEKNTESFTTIPLTEFTLAKIKTYAKLAKSSEIYGFLISPIDNSDGIVRDAVLAIDQNASGGSAGIDGIAAGQSKAELENIGYKPIGFWHSHGNYDVFHSGTDNHNLDTLLGSLAGNNEERLSQTQEGSYTSIDSKKGKIVHRNDSVEITLILDKSDTSYESRKVGEEYLKLVNDSSTDLIAALTTDLRFFIKDGSNLIIAKKPVNIEVRKPKADSRITGAAYSIVTNKKGEIYSEIAINQWCSTCQKEETTIVKDTKLRIIDPENVSIDEKQLLKNLEERVRGFKSGERRIW